MNRAALKGEFTDSALLDVSWGVIAHYIHEHTCYAAQRDENCGHRRCERGRDLEDIAHDYNLLEMPTLRGVKRIRGFVSSTTCHNDNCNHKGCSRAEFLVRWLEIQMSLTMRAA